MLILKINAVHKLFRLDFETYFYNNQSCSCDENSYGITKYAKHDAKQMLETESQCVLQ